MSKLYGTWATMTLIIVVVAIYHLYASIEKYASKDNNILGVPTDQNAVIPGTLTVSSRFNNKVGRTLLPDGDGNVRLVAEEGKNVVVGEKSSMNVIGEKSVNRVGPHTWFPFTDGNSYIRSGKPNGDIHIGDMWAANVNVGVNNNSVVRIHDTWMPWVDGNVYIRPRVSKGNGVVNVGDLGTSAVNVGNNGSVTRIRGRLQFGSEENMDSTDPYYLEKVSGGWNNSSLRLTINDDADEAFEIWGSGCAAGNCWGPGRRQHQFVADGTARHSRQVCVNNACLTESDINNLKTRLR